MTHPGGSDTEQLALPPEEGPRRTPMDVVCPFCGAPARDYCTTPSGEPTGTHKARRRLASYQPIQTEL